MTCDLEKNNCRLFDGLLPVGQRSVLIVLLASVFWHQAEAETRQHAVSAERLSALANQLVEMTADKDVLASCRLHMIEVENVSGPLLTRESLRALETSVDDALNARFPGSSCDAAILDAYNDVEGPEIAKRLADEGQPGFVYTLSFFPRTEGVMLLAMAYRPDGRFAAFSNMINIDTIIAEIDDPETAVDETAPEAAVETASIMSNAPSASTMALGGLEAIGTPQEIAAIRAKKFALMPDDPLPPPSPDIGLRIDIGSSIEPDVIKDLARVFLSTQSGSPSQEPIARAHHRRPKPSPAEQPDRCGADGHRDPRQRTGRRLRSAVSWECRSGRVVGTDLTI